MKNILLGGALIAIALIAVGGYLYPHVEMPDIKAILGSVGTRFPNGLAVGTTATVTQNKMTIGNSGTAIGNYIFGTCSLVSDTSIAATSTGTGTCAATGATAGDTVFVGLATTTTKMAAQWVVIGAVASTDSITVRLLNLTGVAAVPSATNGMGSSTMYRIAR